MEKGTYLDRMLKMDAGSECLSMIRGAVDAARKDITLARRKNFQDDLIKEMKAEHAGKLAAAYSQQMDAALKNLDDNEKKVRDTYERTFENHPGRQNEIERMKIKYDSMTDKEIEEEAFLYIGGASKKFDTVDLELLSGHARRRCGDKVNTQLREKMRDMDYEKPWLRLIDKTDLEYANALRNRRPHDIILKLQDEAGNKSVSPITIDEVFNLAGVDETGH